MNRHGSSTASVMKGGEMPKNPEITARAVRMVREHLVEAGAAVSVTLGAQVSGHYNWLRCDSHAA